MKKGRRPRRRPRLKLSDKAGPDQCPVPGENALFPAQIAGFLAVSRPVPVYPVFLNYVVPVQQLLSLFYALKNETADHIGDTALINAMYLRFHSVGGDMDALAGTPPEWLRHAAEGGDLDEL